MTFPSKAIGLTMVVGGLALATAVLGNGDDRPRPADSDSPNGPGMTLAWAIVGGLLCLGMWLLSGISD